MPKLFDKDENAFSATSMNLVPSAGSSINMNFDDWGTPERVKINQALSIVNIQMYKRKGVL